MRLSHLWFIKPSSLLLDAVGIEPARRDVTSSLLFVDLGFAAISLKVVPPLFVIVELSLSLPVLLL
jgi:hypothetical protein